MQRIKDRAIILRRKPFGEADVLLTLLTEQHGKLRVLAKGARRPTSKLVGHTEPFTIIQGQINFRSAIPILSQVEIDHSIDGLAEDGIVLQRLTLLAEIIDRAMEEGAASEALFTTFLEGSLTLRQGYQPMLFAGLLIRFFGLLGYAPELNHCVLCKTKLQTEGRFSWDSAAGGVVSEACVDRAVTTQAPLSQETLKAMRFLQRQPIDMMGKLQSPPEVIDELFTVTVNYARYILEAPLYSVNISYTDDQLVRS